MLFFRVRRAAGCAGLIAAIAFAAQTLPAAAAPHGQPTATTITPELSANLKTGLSERAASGEFEVAQRRGHRYRGGRGYGIGPRHQLYGRPVGRGYGRPYRGYGRPYRGRPYYGRPYKRRHYDAGAAAAAGVIGLAAGAIAGAAIANAQPPRAVVIDPTPAPYTAEWYRQCSLKYRSFRASDGTFLGYDGIRHTCRLP